MAQELNTKQKEATLKPGEIRPNDTTTVYATDKAKHHAAGTEMEVHTMLAEKLVAAGKATAEPQKAARGKKEEAA